MWSVRWVWLGVLVAILVLGVPAGALAGWPFADEHSAVTLGFGAIYSGADGGDSTHRGLDIAGQEGDPVMAPLDGTVSFIGRVPGTGGGTVLAATVQTASGALTLLPLASASVSRGDELVQGDPVGSLAEDGDASSPGTHLHVGLRKGGLYLDPSGVLVPPLAPETQTQVQEGEFGAVTDVVGSGTVAVPEGATAGSGSGAPSGAGSVVGSGVGAAVGVGVGASPLIDTGASASTRGVGSALVGGTELAPGVTLAADADALAVAGSGGPGILAETGHALAAGGDIAQAASSAVGDGRLGAAISRAVRVARAGARTMALVGVALLCGLGALWPLWRSGGAGEGLGKVPVSAIGDDIAAVASR